MIYWNLLLSRGILAIRVLISFLATFPCISCYIIRALDLDSWSIPWKFSSSFSKKTASKDILLMPYSSSVYLTSFVGPSFNSGSYLRFWQLNLAIFAARYSIAWGKIVKIGGKKNNHQHQHLVNYLIYLTGRSFLLSWLASAHKANIHGCTTVNRISQHFIAQWKIMDTFFLIHKTPKIAKELIF